MLASEHFKIDRTDDDDWFDPILDFDTPLGVDPFLIFHEKDGLWDGAHQELIDTFARCFLFVADGLHSKSSLSYRKAVSLLHFKEPKEFCLGYTKIGTGGAGGGPGKAETIAAAMAEAIGRGVNNISHFPNPVYDPNYAANCALKCILKLPKDCS